MKLVYGLRALALTALIFSSQSCTSDGTEETVEAVEEENQVPDQSEGEEAGDVELPSAEAASVEAEQGVESIDQNSDPGVQALATEQQIAVDEAAMAGVAGGAGQEMAPVPGAEDDSVPSLDSGLIPGETAAPAPVAEAIPMASPELPPEEAPAIPTIADVVADSESAHVVDSAEQAAAPKKKAKKSKAKKSSRSSQSRKAPELNGNEKAYIVQPGDTLASIAATLFGSSREWRNLADLNGLSGSALIFPGDAIKYAPSDKTAAFETRFDGLPKATVAVEKGDTLSKIAMRVMGSASYWKMIWRWNESTVTDPNLISVGMNLQYVSTKDLEGAMAH